MLSIPVLFPVWVAHRRRYPNSINNSDQIHIRDCSQLLDIISTWNEKMKPSSPLTLSLSLRSLTLTLVPLPDICMQRRKFIAFINYRHFLGISTFLGVPPLEAAHPSISSRAGGRMSERGNDNCNLLSVKSVSVSGCQTSPARSTVIVLNPRPNYIDAQSQRIIRPRSPHEHRYDNRPVNYQVWPLQCTIRWAVYGPQRVLLLGG